MTLACPCCKAENDASTSAVTCRRCKADLSLLVSLEERRAFHVRAAAASLRILEGEAALEHLRQAEALRRGKDLHPLFAAACVVAKHYDEAFARHASAI